jgi:hypothetical protein
VWVNLGDWYFFKDPVRNVYKRLQTLFLPFNYLSLFKKDKQAFFFNVGSDYYFSDNSPHMVLSCGKNLYSFVSDPDM